VTEPSLAEVYLPRHQISDTEANSPDARRVSMNWSTTGLGPANDHWKIPGALGSEGTVNWEEIDVKKLK